MEVSYWSRPLVTQDYVVIVVIMIIILIGLCDGLSPNGCQASTHTIMIMSQLGSKEHLFLLNFNSTNLC